jgi:hypothetical protein
MSRVTAAVILSLGLALVAASCGAPRVVDGWEFGGVEACADTPFGGDNTVPCAVQMRQILEVAGARLDQRDPGHPAVVSALIHSLSNRVAGRGTGATVVVVFELADQDASAIGVGHPIVGVGQEHDPAWVTIDYGPLLGEED